MHGTVRWARAGYSHYSRRMAGIDTRHALFPIVQGSMFADLRRECCAELAGLDADGYAIGGLSVGEPRRVSLGMVGVSGPLLPPDPSPYAMGGGMAGEL